MELRGTNLIFIYASICVIDDSKMTLGPVQMLGALFPGRLCLATDHRWSRSLDARE